MSAIAALLPDGRLHLQHGPIDCLCQAWGSPREVQTAYTQAAAFFQTVLHDLCAELRLLRQPLPSPQPHGAVAQAMYAACTPFVSPFITPMAAVAGAVADAVLAALRHDRHLSKAFVNNGGDIAFHLEPGMSLRCGLVTDLSTPALDGAFVLTAAHPSRGLATSGRACKGQGGRSFSFGIADSVTILARTAAQADAAATIVGNAVNLPGHPAIDRRPARDIDPNTDLGDRLITFGVGTLSDTDIDTALDAGATIADTLLQAGLINSAVLAMRGHLRVRQSHITRLEAA
jgi:ApbE superfamily uncharacterized protein (UPF0280 family)